MEFGIFIQGYVPEFRRGNDPVEAEHRAFMEELEAVVAADKAGFKYVWVTEHHFLDEYSHLSANDVICGYLAHATERIHIGSGIFNPLPQVNHPAKLAERVAMLDHLTDRRFEFGTGRGAGSHEILGFLHREGITDTNQTREIWEDVIREFPRMWLNDEYPGYEGTYWSLPPRKILPKPYGAGHPAMWYAAGNTSSWEMAGRMGLGILGFAVERVDQLGPLLERYHAAAANAEPIGAFANDNVMITTAAYIAEDEEAAVQSIVAADPTYLQSNVFRYHDTFPRPEHVPAWPERMPKLDADMVRMMLGSPGMLVGTPEHALAAARQWEAAGLNQLVIGIGPASHEDTLRTIRLLGEHVIPKVDTDPVHRTTRFRESAA